MLYNPEEAKKLPNDVVELKAMYYNLLLKHNRLVKQLQEWKIISYYNTNGTKTIVCKKEIKGE